MRDNCRQGIIYSMSGQYTTIITYFVQAIILAPQSVTLEGITFTKSFVESHIIIQNPNNNSQFVTVNGVHGVFSDTREMMRILSGPPSDETTFNPLVDPATLFTKEAYVSVMSVG